MSRILPLETKQRQTLLEKLVLNQNSKGVLTKWRKKFDISKSKVSSLDKDLISWKNKFVAGEEDDTTAIYRLSVLKEELVSCHNNLSTEEKYVKECAQEAPQDYLYRGNEESKLETIKERQEGTAIEADKVIKALLQKAQEFIDKLDLWNNDYDCISVADDRYLEFLFLKCEITALLPGSTTYLKVNSLLSKLNEHIKTMQANFPAINEAKKSYKKDKDWAEDQKKVEEARLLIEQFKKLSKGKNHNKGFRKVPNKLLDSYIALDEYFTSRISTQPTSMIESSLQEAKQAQKILFQLSLVDDLDEGTLKKVRSAQQTCKRLIGELSTALSKERQKTSRTVQLTGEQKAGAILQRLLQKKTPASQFFSKSQVNHSSSPEQSSPAKQKSSRQYVDELDSIYEIIRECQLCKEASKNFIAACDAVDRYLSSRTGDPCTDACWQDWIDLLLVFQDTNIALKDKLDYLQHSINYFMHIFPRPSYVKLLTTVKNNYTDLLPASRLVRNDLAQRRTCYVWQYNVAKEFSSMEGTIKSTDLKATEIKLKEHCGRPLAAYRATYQHYQRWRSDTLLDPACLLPPYVSYQKRGGIMNNIASSMAASSSCYSLNLSTQKWHGMLWHGILTRVAFFCSGMIPVKTGSSEKSRIADPLVVTKNSGTQSLKLFYQMEKYLAVRAVQSPVMLRNIVLSFSRKDYIQRKESWCRLLVSMSQEFGKSPPNVDKVIQDLNQAIQRFSYFGRSHHYATNLNAILTGLKTKKLEINDSLKKYLQSQSNLANIELKITEIALNEELGKNNFEVKSDKLLIENLYFYDQAYERHLLMESISHPFAPFCAADAIYNPLANIGLLARLFSPNRAQNIWQSFLAYKQQSTRDSKLEKKKKVVHMIGLEAEASKNLTVKPNFLPKETPEGNQSPSPLLAVIKTIEEQKNYLKKKPARGGICNFFHNKNQDNHDINFLDELAYHLRMQTRQQAPLEKQKAFLCSPYFKNKLEQLNDLNVREKLKAPLDINEKNLKIEPT